jgi:hypothetical protein
MFAVQTGRACSVPAAAIKDDLACYSIVTGASSAHDGWADRDRSYRENTLAALKNGAQGISVPPQVALLNDERLQLGGDYVGAANGVLCRLKRLDSGNALVAVPFEPLDEKALIGQALPGCPSARSTETGLAAKVDFLPCRAFASMGELMEAGKEHMLRLRNTAIGMFGGVMLHAMGVFKTLDVTPAAFASCAAMLGYFAWHRKRGSESGMFTGAALALGVFYGVKGLSGYVLGNLFPGWNLELPPSVSAGLIMAGIGVMCGAMLRITALRRQAPHLREPF